MTVLSPLAPTKTGKQRERRASTRTVICESAMKIEGVVSCVPHPDSAYNHAADRNRWLLVGLTHRCGHIAYGPVPERGEDGLGCVTENARISGRRLCATCWAGSADSERLRRMNARMEARL